jgi:hypothetical protein
MRHLRVSPSSPLRRAKRLFWMRGDDQAPQRGTIQGVGFHSVYPVTIMVLFYISILHTTEGVHSIVLGLLLSRHCYQLFME